MVSFVDLFSGGGLGARGAVNGGGKPLLAVDAWELATQTYKSNFPEAEVLCSPIEDLVTDRLPELANKYKPDVLLTSPECTSHSIARGAKPGCEKSRETAIGIVPWVDAMNPRWVIVENVNRMKKWDRHGELIDTLERYEYMVSDLYLNAVDFGAAQSRKRMFLLCEKHGTHKVTKEDLVASYGKQSQAAVDIIDWSGKYQSRPLRRKGRAQATLDRAQRAINTLGKGKPFIIVYYGSDYAGGWQRIDAPLRTITTIDRFGLVTWEDNVPYLRMLQPSELLRAMGGGETHTLPHGSRRDKVKLCGNGVCAPAMEVIFRHINKVMNSNVVQGRPEI